ALSEIKQSLENLINFYIKKINFILSIFNDGNDDVLKDRSNPKGDTDYLHDFLTSVVLDKTMEIAGKILSLKNSIDDINNANFEFETIEQEEKIIEDLGDTVPNWHETEDVPDLENVNELLLKLNNN